MAFELGGRADKFGNRYERRYFVSLMAKVLQGGLLSVQSEPTGDDESGTDIIVEYQGGRKDFHQCKARNGSNEHWTMSALARHKVVSAYQGTCKDGAESLCVCDCTSLCGAE